MENLSNNVFNYQGEKDICPLMSIGQTNPVFCVYSCAWYDTELKACSIARINGNTKLLENMVEPKGAIKLKKKS